MGILERIAAEMGKGEARYSADTYINDYLVPFSYGGNQYFTGGPGLVQTLAGNRASEIVNTLPGYSAALRQCPPAFAAQMVRATVLSQARFTFRNRSTRKVFSNTKLRPLERPWTGATTGELIARNEWHAGVAGNAYTVRQRDRLRVVRPDWVAILYGSHQEPEDAAHALDGELIGYVYQNGGLWSANNRPTTLLPEDVSHWSPIPDPESAGVGMSWITPAIRDMQKDRMSAEHVIRFFEQGATPNLVVKGLTATTKEQFTQLVEMMEEGHAGLANAYRTLYLTAGADATVVGSNLADLDLKNVQGAAETRIASLSRVHPVILGIAEGLDGSSLNAGNFGMARRIWADTWIYPTLQDLASSLGTIIDVPADAELWFDTADVPLLREDGKDAADINATRASAIRQLTDAGFTWESSVDAIVSGDFARLKHSGLFSVQLQPAGGQQGGDPAVDEMKSKVEALGGLFRAGFKPGASLSFLGLPNLEHSGLLPVTLAKKEALPEQPAAKTEASKQGLRHMPGKHNQQNHADGGGPGRGGMPSVLVSFPQARGRATVDRPAAGHPRLSVGGRTVELRGGSRHSSEQEQFRRLVANAQYGDEGARSDDGVYRLRRLVDRGGRPHSETLVSVRPVEGRVVSETGRTYDGVDAVPEDEEAYPAEYDVVVGEGDDSEFGAEPSIRVSLADLDAIADSIGDAATAERVDSGNGPIDVFVAGPNQVGFRMRGDDGDPVEVAFNRRDVRRIDDAIDHVSEHGGTRTIDTANGPVEVTFRGPVGGDYTDANSLIISPPSGGPWGIAATGEGIGALLTAFENNASAAGAL